MPDIKVLFSRSFTIILISLLSLTTASLAQADKIHFDFESGDLQGWRIIKGDFEKIITDRPHFHNKPKVKYNKQGKFHLSTLENKQQSRGGFDAQTGIVESPVFKLTSPEITFLVGGGKHPDTRIALFDFESGKELAKAHGTNNEMMQNVKWDVKAHVGKLVYMQAIDTNSGGWGHITLDNVSTSGTIDQAATRKRAALFAAALAAEKKKNEAMLKRHSFLVCGSQTAIIKNGKVIWETKYKSRDGYVLPNGNVLLAVNRSKDHPGGAVVEITREGKVTLRYQGTQSEVNSAQPTPEGGVVLSEAGPKPRLIEIDKNNKIIHDIPLQCQSKNHHMETRMVRKQPDGTYLAPHLLDFAVKHYDQDGKVLSTISTAMPNDPERKIHSWPFTAIRLKNGNILCGLTHSNQVAEYDPSGKLVWMLTNKDLPSNLQIKDACGIQRLANGNTVITSYASRGGEVKLIEVNPQKEVVWTYHNTRPHGIHHFQILDTEGKPEPWPPMK